MKSTPISFLAIHQFLKTKGWSHQQVGPVKIYSNPNNTTSFEFTGTEVLIWGWDGSTWLLVDRFKQPDTLQGLKERVLKLTA